MCSVVGNAGGHLELVTHATPALTSIGRFRALYSPPPLYHLCGQSMANHLRQPRRGALMMQMGVEVRGSPAGGHFIPGRAGTGARRPPLLDLLLKGVTPLRVSACCCCGGFEPQTHIGATLGGCPK